MKPHLDKLACPNCRAPLSSSELALLCGTCGQVAEYEDGVLNFLPFQNRPESPKIYDDPEYIEATKALEVLHGIHYAKGSLSGWLEGIFKKWLLRHVEEAPRPILDIGCGAGNGFEQMGYPKAIVGVDVSLPFLKDCQSKFPSADTVCCDFVRAPFADSSFETITSMGALEHVFYLERMLHSVSRVLSDTGKFYVLIPCEGGLIWWLLRNVAHMKYANKLGVDYRKIASIEHINKAATIENALKKYFIAERSERRPFLVGGIAFNMAAIYVLRKRV